MNTPAYRLARRRTYRNGVEHRDRAFSVYFQDHRGRKQTFPTSHDREKATAEAKLLVMLVACRRRGQPAPDAARRWVAELPNKMLAVLLGIDLVSADDVAEWRMQRLR